MRSFKFAFQDERKWQICQYCCVLPAAAAALAQPPWPGTVAGPRVRVVAPADMRAASGERGLGLVRSLGCQRLSVGVAIGTHHFGRGGGAARQLLMGAWAPTPAALLQLSPHSEVKASGIPSLVELANVVFSW
ncbi:hypothetical protein PVAP13_9NG037719 [Panicum virgatum]|uniref:Uncharacterized protein n=1 Tax=Panicum virgatum TaxID=38727 RepID=A0A8T0MBE3_PANVG|nr:hypothetical protein PVAP13_9NG037719 [Panicum virgatum]